MFFYKIEDNNVHIVSGNEPFSESWKECKIENTNYEPSFLNQLIENIENQNIKNKKIEEAKAYLASTDYKMLPNYVPKVDEDLDAIIAKRNETREFIRNNNA